MKITVAIPCYNLEDRITACIESVIIQDFQDIEILIIDDCSTDHSVDVINDLIGKHPERDFHLIVNERNLGLSAVRNMAIREARGEALFFVDGDDIIEPRTLSLFHHRMKETHVEVVCGSFRKKDFKSNTYIVKQFSEDTIKGNGAYISYIEKYINGYFNLGIWNNLYRIDFLRNCNIYCSPQYRIFEDRLFTFKVVLNAKSVSYIHDVTYNYCDTPNSICHKKKGRDFLQVYRQVINSVFDVKDDFCASHKELSSLRGVRYLVNYICLTDGLLKKCMESDTDDKEKKALLTWLKEQYRLRDMKWCNIVGPYNKLSYLILMSPFSYNLFQFYFSHLKSVKKLFVILRLTSKDI